MNNKVLTFLGRDSGFGEKNNSAYIELDNKLIIIDCGCTVFGEIKKKLDLNKYEEIKVIITHLHNDHAGSLSQLILYAWFIYGKIVTIYSKCENIKEYLCITGTPEESYVLKQEDSDLFFIKTNHVQYLDAYGFKLKVKGKKIIYTGDTNIIDPFLVYMNDCDELYIDVSKYGGAHIKIDDVVEVLKKIKENGTNVFFMHMDDKEYIKKVTNNEFLIE